MSLSISFRLTLSNPIPSDPPRFVVAGQTGSASGDVKMYEWHRAVSRHMAEHLSRGLTLALQKGEMKLLGLQTDIGQIRVSSQHRRDHNILICT